MGTIVDILILALVALMTFRGLRRGALSTIISLASYGVAYLMATLVYKTSHVQLVQAYGEVGLYLIILPAVFIITIILVRLLGRIMTRTLSLTLAGPVNKLLGGGLGFMKAVVVILAIAATIKFLSPVTGEWYADSRALPFLLQLFA